MQPRGGVAHLCRDVPQSLVRHRRGDVYILALATLALLCGDPHAWRGGCDVGRNAVSRALPRPLRAPSPARCVVNPAARLYPGADGMARSSLSRASAKSLQAAALDSARTTLANFDAIFTTTKDRHLRARKGTDPVAAAYPVDREEPAASLGNSFIVACAVVIFNLLVAFGRLRNGENPLPWPPGLDLRHPSRRGSFPISRWWCRSSCSSAISGAARYAGLPDRHVPRNHGAVLGLHPDHYFESLPMNSTRRRASTAARAGRLDQGVPAARRALDRRGHSICVPGELERVPAGADVHPDAAVADLAIIIASFTSDFPISFSFIMPPACWRCFLRSSSPSCRTLHRVRAAAGAVKG